MPFEMSADDAQQLLAQLHKLQEEFEVVYVESRAKDEALKKSELENKNLTSQLDGVNSKLVALKSELDCVNQLYEEEKSKQKDIYLREGGGSLDEKYLQIVERDKEYLRGELVSSNSEKERLRRELQALQSKLNILQLDSSSREQEIDRLNEVVRLKNKKLRNLSHKKKEVVAEVSALKEQLKLRSVTDVPRNVVDVNRTPVVKKILSMPTFLKQSAKLKKSEEVEIIRSSDLFDEVWYLSTYKDVADSGIDAALHYFLYGAADLRNPGPHFSTAWYLDAYPDVASAKINPLLHYLRLGRHEGRAIRVG